MRRAGHGGQPPTTGAGSALVSNAYGGEPTSSPAATTTDIELPRSDDVAAWRRDPGGRWVYAGGMRYPDGGGLSARGRVQRERVRLEAARLCEQGVRPVQVAQRLRVSTKSVYQWRRRWRAGGDAALASTGPGGATCRLSARQLDRLRTELARGPAEHGWADQRWTLARITALIGRLFHVRYTLRGTSYLLQRIGFTVQVPARRAAERNEQAIATWRTETWAKVRG